MNKKYLILLIVILFFSINIYSKDNTSDTGKDFESLIKIKEFRGVNFYPKNNVQIKEYMTIDIPDTWKVDILDKITDENVICAFSCGKAEFAIIGSIAIYSNKTKSFAKTMLEIAAKEVEPKSFKKNEFVEGMNNIGSSYILSYFGIGKKMGGISPGNLLSTFYYNREKNITIKVNFYLTYFKSFNEEEWYDLLMNVFAINRSIKLM